MLEELKQVREALEMGLYSCSVAISGGGAVATELSEHEYPTIQKALALLDTLIAGQGWRPIDDEARAGHVVDVYFLKNGKYVHSRTSYLIEEQRWNGMSKGQQPLGYRLLPELPPPPQPASEE